MFQLTNPLMRVEEIHPLEVARAALAADEFLALHRLEDRMRCAREEAAAAILQSRDDDRFARRAGAVVRDGVGLDDRGAFGLFDRHHRRLLRLVKRLMAKAALGRACAVNGGAMLGEVPSE